jgi:hypothetical protein
VSFEEAWCIWGRDPRGGESRSKKKGGGRGQPIRDKNKLKARIGKHGKISKREREEKRKCREKQVLYIARSVVGMYYG